MRAAGRLIAAVDDVRQNFVFSICRPCTFRLERLPLRLQRAQMAIAIRELTRHPERYPAPVFFDTPEAATIYCRLEADRLAGATMLKA